MKYWTKKQWETILLNPQTDGWTSKILYTDVHRAQQTDRQTDKLQDKPCLSCSFPNKLEGSENGLVDTHEIQGYIPNNKFHLKNSND